MSNNVEKKLTFDDVLLVPRKSSVLPKEVDCSTKLTKNITLNIPIMSAAMDTVTESAMAIALSRQGGIGVIHKNLTIEDQALMVDKVKRYESGMIRNPITLDEGKTVGDAKQLMEQYSIGGLPVLSYGKLVGIITKRDIRFESDLETLVKDRMTSENLITVNSDTSNDDAKKILQEHRIERLLVVDKHNNLDGLITVKDLTKKEEFPFSTKDKNGRLRVAAAISVRDDWKDRIQALANVGVDAIVVDTAHGHSEFVLELVKKVKKEFPVLDLIAGNVASAEATEDLIKAGADCVKIGIGAGSSCTTRIIAGVGVPQLSAVMDCAKIGMKHKIPIIADGGIRYSGDIAKSLAAGANVVMLGGMLAGMDESPGETIVYEGRRYKSYRGMGSLAAMKEGGGERYFQQEKDELKLVPEGIEGMVPFRGPVNNTIFQLVGGLKSSMGYCGAKDLSAFYKNKKFIEISSAGVKESHPHEVSIIKEAPNYQGHDK
ncbi:MAG: IMP dehydrogenase [Candidatus Marinimicrobia bacterium]|nr:IMP dehydrogenase [Candidatus Neomarinimicrobiota bacterium]